MALNTEEDLDAIRAENIAKNRALLAEMFSETSHDFVVRKKPAPKPQRKAQRPPKRKVDAVEGSDDDVEKPAPKAAAVPTEAETGGVRRSGRNAGKKVNYGGDGGLMEPYRELKLGHGGRQGKPVVWTLFTRGRDLKGTKNNPKNLRTAPQSSDQTFDNSFNNALLLSVETKKPIRVIRGYKLKSQYAPPEGYRYDGLYTVEKAWMERGVNPGGFKVCKFLFKRIPGQPPLPIYTDDGEEAENEGSEASEADATAAEDNDDRTETAVDSET
ncbi:hypothetical protein EIP86_002858 [Pleurotus ostreatoroseus]|nr:hypothetical protein EIP86_002858 [Pleurotus ostreatoroseus]